MSRIILYSWLLFAGTALSQGVFFNEIRANDAGTDDAEFIELIGPAGTDISGWILTHFNGTGTTMVFTFTFPENTIFPDDGVIGSDNKPIGFIVLKNGNHIVANADFDWGISGLQNGPDGLLLTDSLGVRIQALTWNGTGDLSGGIPPWRNIGSDANDDRSLSAPDDVTESSALPWALIDPTPGALNGNQNSGDISLPVQLTSFTARAGDAQVTLAWVTAAEVNNLGFILERCEQTDSSYVEIASYLNCPELAGQGNSSHEKKYLYIDETVFNGHTYLYRLSDVDVDGIRTPHPPVSAQPNAVRIEQKDRKHSNLPDEYRLLQNYPNPFNPATRIRFQIPRDDLISLIVYNLTGQAVATVFHGELSAGTYELEWAAHTQNGRNVPAGIYFYVFSSDHYYAARKMVLVR